MNDSAHTRVGLNVQSETGLLERLIVHTPGVEMEMVSPTNRGDLLFEDILYLDQARVEHETMCEVFEKIVGSDGAVLQIDALLLEALGQEDARHDLVDQLCRISAESNLQAFESDLKKLPPDELYDFVLTGRSSLKIISRPLPNLMFTRDPAAVVGDHIIVSHPATAARARESIIVNVILHHHPGFVDVRDKVIGLPRGVTFEGGDLLVVSPNVVMIGHSERTSFGGVMMVAQALFERTPVEHVVMVNLPKERYCMHLDTVFTFASDSECVVFPPLVDLTGLGNIVHFTSGNGRGRFHSEIRPNIKTALEELVGRELAFIPCGGSTALSQEREQWTDGANFFAAAPGVIIGYERNERTFDVVRERGFHVVSARSFLSYHEDSDYGGGNRIAIKLGGHELSRGRGGPRCMTMPLSRQNVHAN